MDLENCCEGEQETRQKRPVREGNSDSLLKTRGGDPPEEKGRYGPVQAVHPCVRGGAMPLPAITSASHTQL